MKQNFYFYIQILLFLLMIQCSSTSFIDNGVIVNGIKSVNPNVRIVARDKSFEITASKLTKLTDINPNISPKVDPLHPYEYDFFRIITDFPLIYGKEVFIHIPGRSEPYYGILDINPLAPDAVGAIATQKQYEIKIPELLLSSDYTLDGKAVVVYEHYVRKIENSIYKGERVDRYRGPTYLSNYKAWTLWISDKPMYIKKDLR